MIGLLYTQLPEIFLGPQLDALTGGLYRWRSVQNLRSKAQRGDLIIPEGIFIRLSARKIAICRDQFFAWMLSRASVSSKSGGKDE